MKKMIVALVICLPVWFCCAYSQSMTDINVADVAQLSENLKGIGPAKALAIVEFRAANGPFTSVEDLLAVKGIGPKTLENIRGYISVGPGSKPGQEQQADGVQEKQTRLVIRRIISDAKSSAGNTAANR
jgi:competence protein ComEA